MMAEIAPPRVYLHDANGKRIGELTSAENINRAFRTMATSRATVTVAETDPLVAQLDPRRGRILVIESADYPLAWAGKLVDTSGQPGSGTVRLDARSLDTVFTERNLPASTSVSGTADSVVRELLSTINRQNPTGIEAAPEMPTGEPYTAQFGDQALAPVLTRVARETGREWWVEYDVTAREIDARLHYGVRGFDRFADVQLSEGQTGSVETETWRINTDGLTHRIRAIAGQESVTQDFASRGREERLRSAEGPIDSALVVGVEAQVHGYPIEHTPLGATPLTAAERIVVLEHLRPTGLAEAAEALLTRPERGERRVVLKVPGNTTVWADLLPGNVIGVSLPSPVLLDGFSGPVRIVSVQPREEEGDVRLVTEVLRAA